MKEPWCKFYPRDWRGDSQLHALPLTARGLWVELLCLMAMSERKGYLLVNGKAPTPQQIATLVCADVRTVLHTLLQLENARIFTKDENGVIYSRRMARDAAISEERRAAINSRWKREKDEKQALLNIQNTIQKSDFVYTHIPVPEIEEEERASPSFLEVKKYAEASGIDPASAERFFQMNDSSEWRDAHGHKIRHWKRALIAFSKKDTTAEPPPSQRTTRKAKPENQNKYENGF